ncbi:unnamed protein product [Phaedon cochleariae]|uniref:DUF8207 domain-containing protein n=1 Tax=Phaedon cochleariae TaxID=80249 RepID=A0A9N9SC22_PHACE|nr:unnamed protein product [Phaedon cochleariae]
MKEHWTSSDKIDKIYGPIYDSSNSKWRLGYKEIDFDARTGYIKIDGKQVKGTPGINELIFYDVPENYNKDDLYGYKQILELSEAHLNAIRIENDGGLAHTLKGDKDFGYSNLCNVKTPILKKDAANKEYVDQIRNHSLNGHFSREFEMSSDSGDISNCSSISSGGMEFDDSSNSSDDYQQTLEAIDDALNKYESAAQQEFNVRTKYTGMIRPTRDFSACVILKQRYSPKQISFNTYEWTSIIDILRDVKQSFFKPTVSRNNSSYPDEYEPVMIKCGDFVTLHQFMDCGVKQISIRKDVTDMTLNEEDVTEILRTYIYRCGI